MDTLGMISIGEKLRRQRLQQGVSLDQVATQTKIGLRLLEAIEAEQFEKLPGGVFRKSFVLQYARALGLDEESITSDMKHLRSFDEEVHLPGQDTPVPDVPPLEAPRDWSAFRTSLGSLVWVFVVMVLCAGVYMWWQNLSAGRSGSPPEPVVEASPKREPERAPSVQTAQVQATSPEQTTSSNAATQQSPPTATGPVSADLTAQIAASKSPVRVGVTAGEETWLQISRDGKRVYSDTLKPNETKFVEADGLVRILTGNAGGLDVSLNGRSVGPIGPHGHVRMIELRPDGFQIVPRTPPSADPDQL